MKPSLTRFKFTDADAPYVEAFEAAAVRLGWSRQRIEQAFGWYRDYGRQAGSPEQLRESFEAFATEKRWAADEVTGALNWHGLVQERGVEAIELDPAPPRADSEVRLAEIRKIATEDPDAYNADQAMQDEHMDLIAALRDAPAASGAPPAQPAGDKAATGGAERLEQIRKINRETPNIYDADRKLQEEHQQLIAASLQAPASAPAADSIETGGAAGVADVQGGTE